MKHISISELISKEAIQIFAKRERLADELVKDYYHPQEDFLIVSDNPPIFVVSDGVTLDYTKLIKDNVKYPDPSPAGDVSRIFCESVIKYVKEKYETFVKEDAVEVFKYANGEVGKYNERAGKTDISGNITGYYSATGSFAVIKDNKAYWASICDSFIAHFNRKMNLKFTTKGLCRPYAVINGEERMVDYLESGVLNLEKEDRVFVFTDGFEDYMANPDFLELFKKWDEKLKERIAQFSEKMNLIDPEKYGHERSLIAILV
jgi:hypothetical protein